MNFSWFISIQKTPSATTPAHLLRYHRGWGKIGRALLRMTSLTDARWELSGKGGGAIEGRFFNSFHLAAKAPSGMPQVFKCELLVPGRVPLREFPAISGTSRSVRDYSIHPQLPDTHTHTHTHTHKPKTKIRGRGDELNFGHQQFQLPSNESSSVFPIWRWGISSWRHPFYWFSGKRQFWRKASSLSTGLLWWSTSVRSPMMMDVGRKGWLLGTPPNL